MPTTTSDGAGGDLHKTSISFTRDTWALIQRLAAEGDISPSKWVSLAAAEMADNGAIWIAEYVRAGEDAAAGTTTTTYRGKKKAAPARALRAAEAAPKKSR